MAGERKWPESEGVGCSDRKVRADVPMVKTGWKREAFTDMLRIKLILDILLTDAWY